MSPRFLDPLRVEEIGETEGRPVWRLLEPLRFDSAVIRARLEAPAGFVTDLASVPRAPLAWLVAGGAARRPAVIHDLLYQTHLVEDRAQADEVFGEAMEGAQDPPQAWRRWVIHWAVRLCGGGAWESGPSRYRVFNNGHLDRSLMRK